MSYIRVIPRDLFNEANLLKCLGQMYLLLERLNIPGVSFEFVPSHVSQHFNVQQDENDGSTYVSNIVLEVRGEVIDLTRPLNSREPWPLYMRDSDDNETPVFTDDGEFTPEFVAFLKTPPLQ